MCGFGARSIVRRVDPTGYARGNMSSDAEQHRADLEPSASQQTIRAGDAIASFDASDGARLVSLEVAGFEIIVDDQESLGRGCYPMVPWAGRVNRGRFEFAGRTHQLPVTHGDHAIHGTGFTSGWSLVSKGERSITMALNLVAPWPLGGRVEHRASIGDDHLHLELEVFAGHDAMPAMVGWHPWFHRTLAGSDAALDFGPARMYEVSNMIPTGELIAPSPPPWDDCFTALGREPVITWSNVLELAMSSSCDHWVLYTKPDHALCVEPQSDAPDAFNRAPEVIEPGSSLVATFDLRWRSLAS